jgi:hypothetical protein
MAARYTDQEITSFLEEPKVLPEDYRSRVQLRQKRGHKERELDIDGAQGNQFRLILRQSDSNALDFSIIFAVCPPGSNQPFRLRRYNGKSHEHTNHLEGNTFYSFHIHMATERYQELGTREDAYAEPTDRFSDFHTALSCMFTNCGFQAAPGGQLPLFKEVLP